MLCASLSLNAINVSFAENLYYHRIRFLFSSVNVINQNEVMGVKKRKRCRAFTHNQSSIINITFNTTRYNNNYLPLGKPAFMSTRT